MDGPQGKAAGDARSDGLKKNQIQGHRHLLTFSDGPRICLGKAFALAESKVRQVYVPAERPMLTASLCDIGRVIRPGQELRVQVSRWGRTEYRQAPGYIAEAEV